MSTVTNPKEKKRLSLERDHYNRNGENNKAWRKAKPLKKKKAERSYRKKSKDLLLADATATGINSSRRALSIKRTKIEDWGSVHLGTLINRKRNRA